MNNQQSAVPLFLLASMLLTGCPGGDGSGSNIFLGGNAPNVLYTANLGSNDVSAYQIDTTTGELISVAGSPFLASTNPSAIAVSSNGSFAYVANSGTSNISAYTINSTTGVLSAATGSPFAAGTAPRAVTVSPNNSFVYVANSGSNNISAYTIDPTTGALTVVAGSPFPAGTNPRAVSVSPNNSFVYVANSGSNNISAYTIDPTTGALTIVAGSPFAAGTSPLGVAVSPNGSFVYVVNQGSNDVSVYTVDPGTGALTALTGTTGNPFPAGTAPVGLTITSNGSFVYVANADSGNVSAYAVNSGTGALTPLAGALGNPYPAATTPAGITIAPNGAFLYVANAGSNNVSSYSVNAGTGALTALAGGIGNPFAAGTAPSGIAAPGRP